MGHPVQTTLIEYGWRYILELFKRYNEYNYIYILFIVSLLYIYLKHKQYRKSIVYPILLFCLIFTNIFIMKPIIQLAHIESTYYRVFWCLQISVFVVLAICFLYNNISGLIRKRIFIVLVMVTIALLGNPVWKRGFYFPENIYSIPNEVLELDQILHDNFQDDCVIIEDNSNFEGYLRMYDATILLPSRTDKIQSYIEKKDYVSAQNKINFYKIKMVILSVDGQYNDEWFKLGFKEVGRTDNCIVCKRDEDWESYQNFLYTPTMINKINELYFIVDCWHSRILYSEDLNRPISDWNLMTDDIVGGHTIASDGEIFIIDDTERNSIKVLNYTGSEFIEKQVINNIEGRPHYVLYDSQNSEFYVLSSLTGTIYVFKNVQGELLQVEKREIPELTNTYVRSMSIIDGYMYLPTNAGKIIKVDYQHNSWKVVDTFEVPNELFNMNYVTKIEDYWYITIYSDVNGDTGKSNIVRTKDLKSIYQGDYQSIYDELDFHGTPYFINAFDGQFFVTEIDKSNGIHSFDVYNNKISNQKLCFFWKTVKPDSLLRKKIKMDDIF